MSKKINWSTEALALLESYQNSDLHIPSDVDEKMRGLSIDADHVRAILDDPDHSIEKIFFVFGMKKNANQKDVFTAVVVGMDSDDNIVPETAYDFLNPCPETCGNLPEPNDSSEEWFWTF